MLALPVQRRVPGRQEAIDLFRVRGLALQTLRQARLAKCLLEQAGFLTRLKGQLPFDLPRQRNSVPEFDWSDVVVIKPGFEPLHRFQQGCTGAGREEDVMLFRLHDDTL